MELRPYIDALRHELAVAAAAGGEDARELADRLTAPLESATRLALLDALSEAAAEITRDLAPGSVEVRLRGREPAFVVTRPPFDEPDADLGPTAPPIADEANTARINLRLPDQLKARAETAAAREGLSVNAWLVRAVAGALHADPTERPRRGPGQRSTGWYR
jgi:hypothetical protein